jgi:hypothetical protein
MKRQGSVMCSIVLLLVALLSAGCNTLFPVPTPTPTNTPTPTPTDTPTPTNTPAPTNTPTPTSTPTNTPTATPTPMPTLVPAVGVPVVSGDWQITLMGAHQESKVSGSAYTYYPEPGYAFLVVDVVFRNLVPVQKIAISSKDAKLIYEDGKTHKADGGGDGTSGLCADCTFDLDLESTSADKISEMDLSLGFVFVLQKDELNQAFEFQFKDMPKIPFSLQ